MAVRLFLSTWDTTAIPTGGQHVTTALQDYLNSNPPAGTYSLGQLYAPPDSVTGLPTKDRAMCAVRSPDIPGSTLELLDGVPGVKLVPSYRLDTLWLDIPEAVRNAIITALTNNGVPSSVWTGITYYRQLLLNLGVWINPKFDVENYRAVDTEFD